VEFYIGLKSVPCRAVPDSKALRSLRHQPGRIVRVNAGFRHLSALADMSVPQRNTYAGALKSMTRSVMSSDWLDPMASSDQPESP